jgi:eukaryotic-like serine/threonine-protein kinase
MIRNGRAYILMDYVEGSNLEVLRQQQPENRFSLSQVLFLMAPIIDAVSYLHHQVPPILHRDIKPANIIVPHAGDGTVLVDFGIAKEYDPDATTTAIRRCSPGYGAPEQYSRGTSTHTDVYGLGATIYALLTGVVPADAFYRMTQLGSKSIDPLQPLDTSVSKRSEPTETDSILLLSSGSFILSAILCIASLFQGNIFVRLYRFC